MKKVLLLLTAVCGLSASSFAQSSDGGKFSIGVEAGLPVGDLKNVSNFIIGGSLKYDHPIAEGTFITGSAGFSSIQGKEATTPFGTVKVGNTSVVPVKAGIKYFLAENFYGEAQAGAAFFTQSGGGTAFAYAPGIGYSFGGGLDAGVRYEAWTKNGSTLSQVGLRVGYSF
ncbi:outer membrane beta-barrel protein [Mucilaginibacter terrigena]|nr:outer membrane beta-barrel protein [Mucilaginibacter terrigena]